MARGDLACPICGQLLGLPNITVTGDRTGVGDHFHLNVQGSWTCANGHTFQVSGNFLLTRTA